MKIIFDGENKAYVGVEHGKKAAMSAQDANKLRTIAQRHGAYTEGDGGDIDAVAAIPKNAYAGSWDEKLQKKVKGYPPEFLFTLFTNVEANNQAGELTNKGKTIFDAVLSAQTSIAYLKDRKFDAQTLRKFLQSASSKDVDLLAMSQQEPSPEAVNKFLAAGEGLMWPENWDKYPNAAGKLAKKVNDQRQQFLINEQSGVFVVGSDHLKEIKKQIQEKQFNGIKPRQAKRPLMISVDAQ
jgi:hypothetical protein